MIARDAPRALILRRGPSKWVELIAWDTSSDTFTRGAWFNGRIYERRSDLSPDGSLFLYFASKFNHRTVQDQEYTYAWTAISRVPWLTALALWPKGNCWWGGGLFASPWSIELNHRPEEAAPHSRHRPTRHYKIIPDPDAHGEDDPIYWRRLLREGWDRTQEWQWTYRGHGGYTTEVPDLWRRRRPKAEIVLEMERALQGYKMRERFRLRGPKGPIAIPGGEVSGANWLKDGRLACVGSGAVSVVTFAASDRPKERQVLLDLTADQPTPVAAPAWASTW